MKPDERVCISIYIDFSISRNCRPFSLLVVIVILSLLISAIEIVSLFFFISRKNTCKLCCFAHSRCHIGYNLNTGSNFNFSSSAVKCYVRVSVYKRYTVSKGKRRKLYVQFKRNFFLEKKGILIIMKVAQLRLQQDQK